MAKPKKRQRTPKKSAKPRRAVKPRPAPRACSLRELARLVGRSAKTVHGWVHDPRWPFARRGPWDPAAARAWADRTLSPNPADDGAASGGEAPDAEDLVNRGRLSTAKAVAQIKVLIEREANLRVDRLIKERQFVRREEAEEHRVRQLEALRIGAMQVPRSLRAVLAHQPPDAVEEVLTRALRGLFNVAFGAGAPGAADGDRDDL